MLTWGKIAARNLVRNLRRSFLTVVAIGLGFAAVNVFGGFTAYIFTGLEETHIYIEGNGHLMVFRRGFLTQGKLDPSGFLLREEQTDTIRKVLLAFPEVRVVTPQLHINGLLSNGEASTTFIAAGRVPSDVRRILRHAKGMSGRLVLFTGKPLQDDLLYGVGVSRGLAKQLKIGLGSNAIAMAPTVSGQVNALDVEVLQLFDAPMELLNDMLLSVPLRFAQSLYDTGGVDRLAVLLDDTALTERVRDATERALAEKKLDVDVKTWQELSPMYSKAKEMFDVIFLFLFVIVFIIVVMSIVNTMGMAVVERTREIGTLRALGTRRRGIIVLFALEGAILGALGSILGLVLTLGSWLLVNRILQPTWVPPMISGRVPLEIYLVPRYMLYSLLFLIVLATVAAILPARKAARQEVVDALGHV
jgi:putative ABC transport system permease protein